MRAARYISVSLFGLLMVVCSAAQMRNPPPASIYSIGGTQLGGPPASIYSLPSRPISAIRPCCSIGIRIGGQGRFPGRHLGNRPVRGFGGFGGYPVFYPVYPYYYDYATEPNSQEVLPQGGTFSGSRPAEQTDATGPTVFDRGYPAGNEPRYGEHYTDSRESRQPASSPAEATPSTPEPDVTTVLVFRDGHQLEVNNYAIMGSTVFVLSPERKKVPLSDLDLEATARENDDRGVDFRVPGAD